MPEIIVHDCILHGFHYIPQNASICGVREMSVHFFFLAFVSSYELFLEESRGLEVVLFVASEIGKILCETRVF